ncbi:MAG: ATPase, T2SS/T4P/T4SS family, partial [Acidimicrobiales bacterium]
MPDYQLVALVRSRVAERLTAEARSRVAAGLAPSAAGEEEELARQFTADAVAAHVGDRLATGTPAPSAAERHELGEAVHAAMFLMGRLQPFLDAEDINNVVIHGAESAVIEWADGRVEVVASPFETDEELEAEVQGLASRRGRTERRFDWANPRLDMRLPDGSRLTALTSIAHRPTIVLRRHRFVDLSLDDLLKLGTIDLALQGLLSAAVAARHNILVAGGTNVGKTTFLRALLALADPDEHLVTIETSLELGLHNLPDRHRNVTALEARQPNAEGVGSIDVHALTEWSARLNPDRMVVGEVLGDEAGAML